jgi:hypothetical protein
MKVTIRSQATSVFNLSRFSLAVLGIVVGLGSGFAAAAVVDSWQAADFSGSLNNGDSVASWSSTGGRALTATSSSGLRPTFFTTVTPADGPVVRFNQDRVRRTDNSPVAGRTSFSIAIVFRLNGVGAGGLSQWYNNTGLVDAEQGGVTADWGVAVTADGRIGWGIGNPDKTIYLTNAPSLVDSNFHAGVFTWGDGEMTAYLDNQYLATTTTTAAGARNNAGLAFGRLLTDANQALIGDIVEVRFYDTKLTGGEATNVIQELRSAHIDVNVPVIYSFTASTNQVVINNPVTLTWTVSNATSRAIQPVVGTVGGPTGSIQVVPRTNTTYTLIASNGVAVRTRTVSVVVDQLPPIATNQTVIASWGQAKAITLTGSDPQGSNLTYAVVTPPAHGSLSGTPPNVTYTPTIGYAGNDQFTFKVNDGEFDSAPATVSIQVLTAPAAPTNILVSTTNLSSSARPGSFLASFTAVDPNAGDVHTFTLVPGFGDNARFILTNNLLFAGDTFVGTNFSIRVRATDVAALWFEKTFQLSVTTNVGAIVINEFHYNPDENSVREEFIELHNPTDAAVDVSQWELSGAVNFTLPLGSVIPARQFLVVAQEPAVVQARYGVAALGPWDGGLASEGEKITLEDANGQKIDEVDYSAEFPWPISADGTGASAALVNPQMDNDLGSSWRSEFPPTPGATNRAFAANAAPNIRQVKHTPQSPASTNNIVITAKVTDPQGVASVQLQYQLVTPGNYLPARLPVPISSLIAGTALEPTLNPAYTNAANWVTVPMVDNGTSGDAVAADDTYTAVLPPQANRVLVRYRIVVTDALGLSRRAPFEDDPSLNFACYVYNGVPDYQGTTAAALQALPVYTLIARAQDVSECTAYDGNYQIPQFLGSYAHPGRFVFNWPGTLVYDGEVYDNIAYRLRGANGRYQPGKRNWRFELNRGRYFAARDQFGEKFPRKWSHLTTGKGSNNRLGLTYGLNEVVNYFLWNKAGVPAPHTLYFHFRVVDGAAEAPDQYGGDFWGLNWLQEDYDGAFLDTHGMAKGNLYKLINASFTNNLAADMVQQRRYQGPFAVTNGMDGAVIQTGLLTAQTADWIRANVNVDAWYRYHAVCEAVRHYDFWPDANKNAAWYFEPTYGASNNFYGRFWTLPWDTDSTWGATWNSGQDLVYNGIFLEGAQPDLQRDYRNTVRELRDLLFQPDQINAIIDAQAARIAAFVPADLARWSNAPASGGNYVSLTVASGFITPAFSAGLAGQVSDMKEFMFTGGNHTWWIDRQIVGAGGWITRLDTVAADGSIPTQPVIYYVGQTNYPMNSLTFECLPFADPQGAGTFAAMQWRLAEVQDTNQPAVDPRVVPPLEWDASWTSGPLATWSNRITIPGIVVETNKLYRARVRHQDSTGRWSRWSAPVEFRPTAADIISELRQNLRFTEVMYNPPDQSPYLSDDLEFLELQNIGGTSLNIGGLTFTAGITFTFTNGTTLAPGQRLLLGRNPTALQAKYPGLAVHGIYSGKLDNAGETVRLSTPTSVTVLELTYGDSAPWPVTADGMGWSLVLDDPVTGRYRVSSAMGGSPGTADPASAIAPIVINELLTHTDLPQVDAIELHNPTATPVNVGGWFLSDDKDVPKKFRLPNNTIISAGGYLVYHQTQYDTNGLDFNLNSLGDEVYLFSGNAVSNLTGYVHEVPFGAAANGVSFGRNVNSAGMEDFVALTARTLDATNARPLVGPVVISEIMFQPPLVGTNENYTEEFIELQNVALTNVPLYLPAFPTNTWRLGNAVSFNFPTNVTLPVGGRLLVVGFDPKTNATTLANFRATYALTTNTPIYGPWSGRLDNSGESIELKFPDAPELDGFVPYVMVEKVSYRPVSPWPEGAAGTGQSLQRRTLLDYANDPMNWFVAPSTAGALGAQTSEDVDGDGMPDLWELQNGLDVFLANGTGDADGDGFSNFAEWVAGTNPHSAASVLKLAATTSGGGVVQLGFQAMAGRSYTLLAAPQADAEVWFSVTNLTAVATNRNILLTQPTSGGQFYRLVTPAQP